jgi:hypothetical protein
MNSIKAVIAALLVIFAYSSVMSATQTEQDIINKYLQKTEKKHKRKLGWISGSFILNRINRDNDYNKFAMHQSENFTDASLSWLSQAPAFDIEFGIVLSNRIAWSLGGEYWMKFGESQTGTFEYIPDGGVPTTVTDIVSELSVFGVSTGVQYYLTNPPVIGEPSSKLSIKATGSVGYYQVNWDVWDGYENLNLSTSLPSGTNTTYSGSAPGVTMGMGIEYPTNLFGMVFGFDFRYLYLNFNNVGWYNSLDQEIIATWDFTEDSRVNLGLSGFRGRLELKRFFSW